MLSPNICEPIIRLHKHNIESLLNQVISLITGPLHTNPLELQQTGVSPHLGDRERECESRENGTNERAIRET